MWPVIGYVGWCKEVRELAEQAEELMVKRVQELRDEFGMSRSKTYDLEMKEYVARMDRILHTLSEEDREWLDNQLVDKFCISETECRELYMNGFRDAMRLIMAVGL